MPSSADVLVLPLAGLLGPLAYKSSDSRPSTYQTYLIQQHRITVRDPFHCCYLRETGATTLLSSRIFNLSPEPVRIDCRISSPLLRDRFNYSEVTPYGCETFRVTSNGLCSSSCRITPTSITISSAKGHTPNYGFCLK